MTANKFKLPTLVEELSAKTVQGYLDRTDPTPLPADVIAKMGSSEKLNYARRFDQTKMPAWRDPRKA